MLSDVVFAWRAIVLWKYDRRVVAILSICVLRTFGVCPRIVASISLAQNVVMGLTAASIYDLKLLFQFHQTVQGLQNLLRLDREATAIFVGPILCTNLLSTSFIAWKAWYVVWFLVSVLVLS